jgi:PKD repeat protein
VAHPDQIPGGAGDYDMAWGTFSASGDLLSAKMHGGSGSDNGVALVDMGGGSLAVLGFTNTGTTDWSGSLILTDADGDASCGVIDLELTWTNDEAIVAPFTSITGSGFSAFPYELGTVPVTVSSSDPCCAVAAAFSSASVDGTWTFTNTSTGATSYSWDLGDGTTSTEASPSHTYATNGSYTVCLTATAACGDATTCQTISVGVGLEEQAMGLGLSLYPSPAAEQFTVQSERSAIASVQLIDSDGRMVQDFTGVARTRVVVPTEALPSGVYAVRVLLDNGAVQHMRAVVAH